jgi:hypothetical protein
MRAKVNAETRLVGLVALFLSYFKVRPEHLLSAVSRATVALSEHNFWSIVLAWGAGG